MPDIVHRFGAVVWREFMTPDLAATTAFYTALFGWTTEDTDMGDGSVYRVFHAQGAPVAGAMAFDAGLDGLPPAWSQAISVPDVDAAVEAATAAGALLVAAPMDIAGVGRYAVVIDPQGAPIGCMRFAHGDGEPPSPPPFSTFVWETLSTPDPAASRAFYAAFVGWAPANLHGTGILTRHAGPEGGVADVQRVEAGPARWMSHVMVPSLATARHRVGELGGAVLVDEVEVPQIGRFAVIRDPIGGVLALFEPTRDLAM